jgi:signal peptidase I
MWPFLKEGDLVSLTQTNDYYIGDVVLFRDQKEFIIHRIVKIENNQFFTKGDRSLFLDDLPLNKNQILGRIKECKSSPVVANYSLKTLSRNKFTRYFYLIKIYFALR